MAAKPEDLFDKQIQDIALLLKQADNNLAQSTKRTEHWPAENKKIQEIVIPALQQYKRDAEAIQKPLPGVLQKIKRAIQPEITRLETLAKDAPRHPEVRSQRLEIRRLKFWVWFYPKRRYFLITFCAVLAFIYREPLFYWLGVLFTFLMNGN